MSGLSTVYICWVVQVYTQDSTIRKGKYQDIICDLCSSEVRGCGELELDPFNIEDGQRAPVNILKIACGDITA
jgi:hypothetical protein